MLSLNQQNADGLVEDFVKEYPNEPEDFHWKYGYMMSAAYLHGSSLFQKNQRDNINQWLWSYWRWVVDQSYTARG